MIDSLRGVLGKGAGEKVLVEVNGVGYGLYISKRTKDKLPTEGSEIFFFTHTYVRENQFDLYAFLTDLDRDIFTFLLKGNGVGPKLALSITSYYEGEELLKIIQNSEVNKLVAIPGVGKKKSEKLLIDLKDKFKDYFSSLMEKNLMKSFSNSSSNFSSPNSSSDASTFHASKNLLKDFKGALKGLGYKDSDIQTAIQELDFLAKPPTTIEEALRAAMRIFASNNILMHRGKSNRREAQSNG